MAELLRRHARALLAILVVPPLWFLARGPSLGDSGREALAARFRFERVALNTPAEPRATIRRVHPSLAHIAGWISSVGAAVAASDLDGDGLTNDLALVDPRSDTLSVLVVPGTGDRYTPFVLDRPHLDAPEASAPMGVVPGDFDEDGRRDLLAYYWGRPPVIFLCRAQERPDGGLALGPDSWERRELVPERTDERWYLNAATRADLDGDGHPDLVLGAYFQDGARVLDWSDGPDAPRQTMQDSMSRARNGGRDRFFLWTGGPSLFTEVETGLPEEELTTWTLAIGAADLNDDGLPEVYLANDFAPDTLLLNRSQPGRVRFERLVGKRTLLTPRSKTLGRDSFKGMGVDFGDLNGDGRLDLHVTNIAAEYALEEAHLVFLGTETGPGEEPAMVEQGDALGLARDDWAWENRIVDLDGDGVPEVMHATGFLAGSTDRWPELHEAAMGNDQLLHDPRSWHRFGATDDLSGHAHDPLYVRGEDGRYWDVAPAVGLGEPAVSRGIASADFDGDGDLDLAVARQWTESVVYWNRGREERRTDSRFLGLHLVLPLDPTAPFAVRSGHPRPGERLLDAIGAMARVRRLDGKELISFVDGGNGHSGVRGPELLFGLGSEEANASVDIEWRDREGELRTRKLELGPGWHTILLGTEGPEQWASR
jgi:hypothetical protein